MAGATQPPQGIGEAFGIKRETTYGTAVSPDIWWRPVSNSMKRKDPWMPLSGPTGSAVNMTTTRAARFTPDVSGRVVLEADYDFIGYLIMLAIGDTSGSGPSDTTAYTHTVDFAATIPSTTPQSFTAARITELEQFQFAGCVIDAIEFAGRRDSLVTVSIDVIGQSGGDADVADTIGTLSTSPFVEFHDSVLRADFGNTGTTLSSSHDQNGGAEAIDWAVRFENNYRAIPAAGGNSLRAIRQPTFGGYRAARMMVSRDYFDDKFFDVYHQSTLASAFSTFGIACTSNELAGANSQEYELDLRFNAGYITDGMNEYGGGPDVLGENITIMAGYDGSNAPAEISLINQQSNNYDDDSGI